MISFFNFISKEEFRGRQNKNCFIYQKVNKSTKREL